MEIKILKALVKKHILFEAWLKIEGLKELHSDSTATNFAENITGNHSWYLGALNNAEDIQLSSLLRILAQLSEENITDNQITFEEILSENILKSSLLLNYLSSTKEEGNQLVEIIRDHRENFEQIRLSLKPRFGKLDADLQQGYDDLKIILEEMETD